MVKSAAAKNASVGAGGRIANLRESSAGPEIIFQYHTRKDEFDESGEGRYRADWQDAAGAIE
jgi:hypothetical protein